jgi:hypothetical protein
MNQTEVFMLQVKNAKYTSDTFHVNLLKILSSYYRISGCRPHALPLKRCHHFTLRFGDFLYLSKAAYSFLIMI